MKSELEELIEKARRLDYDASSIEAAHNRIDAIAEALAILAASVNIQRVAK